MGIRIEDPDYLEIYESAFTYNRSLDERFGKGPYIKRFDTYHIKAQSIQANEGLLRLHIQCTHGRVMLASVNGLAFISTPTVSEETERLSTFPNVLASFIARSSYTGADAHMTEEEELYNAERNGHVPLDGHLSSHPQQLWWQDVTVEGRLADLNRALTMLTYWPDLNWNSDFHTAPLPCLLPDPYSSNNITECRQQGQPRHLLERITLTASSILYPALPKSIQRVYLYVQPVNDAPQLSMPENNIFHPTLLTADLLSAQISALVPMTMDEDSVLQIPSVLIRDVDISPNTFVQVNLTAQHGSIVLSTSNPELRGSLADAYGTIGLRFVQGSGLNASSSIFRAPLHIVNQVLDDVLFYPDADYHGPARLYITVYDLHNYGMQTMSPEERSNPVFGLLDTQTLHISVRPVNDAPDILLPADFGQDIFILDEGNVTHIAGALRNPLDLQIARVNSSNAYKSGYEIYRFHEPQVQSSDGFGRGRLDWIRKTIEDIAEGIESSSPRFYTVYGAFIYYSAFTAQHGFELHRDNGLEGSSEMLLDLLPGSKGAHPSFLHVHRDHLYFAAEGLDTHWMLSPDRYDACQAFRRSGFDPRMHYAVSQDTHWMPGRVYDCPQACRLA
jgi:ELWxxDGT repeat protein